MLSVCEPQAPEQTLSETEVGTEGLNEDHVVCLLCLRHRKTHYPFRGSSASDSASGKAAVALARRYSGFHAVLRGMPWREGRMQLPQPGAAPQMEEGLSRFLRIQNSPRPGPRHLTWHPLEPWP